jgi:peptidoglycan/LPS O-acetylase OafA/YrhL
MVAQGVLKIGAWMPAWIGVFGVYLFFVHTCLVLMWSLERKPHTLDFYIRRLFRIYPLAIVAVLFVVIFHLSYSRGDPQPVSAFGTVVENMLLIQNLGRRPDVIGVMWSLPLEVDMYILLPVLFFFVRRNFSLWSLLPIWALACGMARLYLSHGNDFVTVIPCFLPGVMAYVLFARIRPRLPGWTFPIFISVLLVLYMHFSSVEASWPTCLALGLGLPLFRQIRFGPLKRIAHELAKYSYGIYLGHAFALGIAFETLNGHSRWLQVPLALCLTALFSVAGYHLVEHPLILYGAKVAARAELRYEQHQF